MTPGTPPRRCCSHRRPGATVMSLMGWSSAEMAARYQHVTDTIREGVAGQVDTLICRARDTADPAEGTVPVSRSSLTADLAAG